MAPHAWLKKNEGTVRERASKDKREGQDHRSASEKTVEEKKKNNYEDE